MLRTKRKNVNSFVRMRAKIKFNIYLYILATNLNDFLGLKKKCIFQRVNKYAKIRSEYVFEYLFDKQI